MLCIHFCWNCDATEGAYASDASPNNAGISLDQLTTLVPLVVSGNFNDRRCRGEDPVLTGFTEDNYTVHWRLATGYATAVPPPMRDSVPVYETKQE